MLNIREFEDQAWGHCLTLSNDLVELLLPFEFGPRVLRFAFREGPNHFGEFPAQRADPDQARWHSYGGHRLWHGPEDLRRTYLPDNGPISLGFSDGLLLARQAIEPPTQLQKEIEIQLEPDAASARVTHRIHNHGLFEVRLAVWAISVMAPGGRAILPLPPRGPHTGNLQAQTSLNLWAYTNLADPRWHFSDEYLAFQQDPTNTTPQKIGLARSAGWLAHINNEQVFVKQSAFVEDQPYPDQNSSLEIYADHKCVELESLSPLTVIQPVACAELQETWQLFPNITSAQIQFPVPSTVP